MDTRRCTVIVKQTHPGMGTKERKRRVKVHLQQRVVVAVVTPGCVGRAGQVQYDGRAKNFFF